MPRTVNKEAVDACVQYIRDNPKEYSIVKFFQENGLFHNPDTSSKDLKISCPFHKDSNPSMRINEEANICNCFSCGNGGDYLKIVETVQKEILNNFLGFYNMINNILVTDLKLRLATGYSTIFREEIATLESFKEFKRRRFHREDGRRVKDFGDLFNQMKAEAYDDMPSIKYAILYAQQGYEAESIMKALRNEQVASTAKDSFSSIDINSIMEELNFHWDGEDSGNL